MVELSPAILTNDISDFRKRYAELFAISHYFTKLHLDFIDGQFLPNKTLMPKDLSFLKSSPLTLIAHFMVFNPENYFEDCINIGCKWVTIHYEAFPNSDSIQPVIDKAKNLGLKIGLAINPETPLHSIGKFLQKVDSVQLMGIHPGSQGRTFMPETLNKIRELRSLSNSVIIIVDGGIRVGNARQCAKAGADILVTGSAIIFSEDKDLAIEALRADIDS